ncbi:hypothetical protein WJX73_006390 [Symbiochloris irregularis]|uniref:Uncharacterized protein n=1 Tax=Symbiochloris irregularis TaxID=706552 RepID=A0AAW1NEZ0_9CHLO
MSNTGSDADDFGTADLFVNKAYEKRRFLFEQTGLELELLVSPATATDHDLTGQILWPGAHILADYLAQTASAFTAACELGAGLGLVSLVCAARHCPVVATDHSEEVLSVLAQNCSLNRLKHPVRCMQLDWGDECHVLQVLEASPQQQGYPLLLGADVCYNLNAMHKLFAAASRLLARNASARFMLAYVSRAATLDRSFSNDTSLWLWFHQAIHSRCCLREV